MENPEIFSQKESSFVGILNFQKKNSRFHRSRFYLQVQYLAKGTFFLAETFRIFQKLLELPVAKIPCFRFVVDI